MTLFTSRYLTETEAKYFPVEGDALAVAYRLEKCKHFILGIDNLTVAVDQKAPGRTAHQQKPRRHPQPKAKEPEGEDPQV